jgi:DNA polymerase-3 subunit alpha
MQVPLPKLAKCELWTLTEKLDHEKDVTGMFMSGHPLDHFKFELAHYQFTTIVDFNEVKDNVSTQKPNLGRTYKLAGLITNVQHRITKTGKNFGSFIIEDFTGKSDFVLWSEDYVKYQHYLEVGQKVFIVGQFRNRFNQPDNFEFKITQMALLETVRQNQTRSLELNLHPGMVTTDMITFFENNLKNNPGKSSFKLNFIEPREQLIVSLLTFEKGLSLNDELIEYIHDNPDISVQVNLL